MCSYFREKGGLLLYRQPRSSQNDFFSRVVYVLGARGFIRGLSHLSTPRRYLTTPHQLVLF